MSTITTTPTDEYDYLKSIIDEARSNKDGKTPTAVELDTTGKLANILGLPPVMTYEGIILLNPLDSNPFIFSEGEDDRKNELFFYQTHKDIELELFPTVMSLLQITENPNMEEDALTLELEHIKEGLSFALRKMLELYRNLDSGAFGRFRGFFEGIKFRSKDGIIYPGPSGASSAIFPILDITLGIETVEPLSKLAHDVRPRIKGRGYATIEEIDRAKNAVSENGSLLVRFESSPQITTLLKECIDIIKKFRVGHRANVQKFLPEVMAGKLAGTGGAADVPKYLGQIIDNTKKAGN